MAGARVFAHGAHSTSSRQDTWIMERPGENSAGDDASALAFIADGGNGCISVTSNVAPGVCRNMYLACRRGQMATAQRLASMVARLTAVLFREINPTPVKYALSLLGVMSPRVRLPLVERC
jgi:4-hydroxy-tetrahydrodipicolinate synthase